MKNILDYFKLKQIKRTGTIPKLDDKVRALWLYMKANEDEWDNDMGTFVYTHQF